MFSASIPVALICILRPSSTITFCMVCGFPTYYLEAVNDSLIRCLNYVYFKADGAGPFTISNNIETLVVKSAIMVSRVSF